MRFAKLVVTERIAEPFEDVAGRLDPPIDVLFIAAAAEPRRAQAAVMILQPERIHLIPLHEVGRFLILAVQRLAPSQAGFYRQAKPDRRCVPPQPPRESAGPIPLASTVESPIQALIVHPLVVQICVVLQRNELERQFRFGIARLLFRFDQILS